MPKYRARFHSTILKRLKNWRWLVPLKVKVPVGLNAGGLVLILKKRNYKTVFTNHILSQFYAAKRLSPFPVRQEVKWLSRMVERMRETELRVSRKCSDWGVTPKIKGYVKMTKV